MPDLGYAVIGGVRFPLERIWLAGGKIMIRFRIRGPQPELCGNLTVFGEDGLGVFQGREVRIPPLGPYVTWTWDHELSIAQVSTADAAPLCFGTEGEVA